MDLRNLLTIAEAITRAALKRPESRGAHFRVDRQGKDEHLGKITHVIQKGTDGQMQLREEQIPQMPPELRQIAEDHQ